MKLEAQAPQACNYCYSLCDINEQNPPEFNKHQNKNYFLSKSLNCCECFVSLALSFFCISLVQVICMALFVGVCVCECARARTFRSFVYVSANTFNMCMLCGFFRPEYSLFISRLFVCSKIFNPLLACWCNANQKKLTDTHKKQWINHTHLKKKS